MADEQGKQEKQETTPLSSRVRKKDREDFIQLASELGETQHETFHKMLNTFKKMNELDKNAPGRKNQAEELQGIFDRLLTIYNDVLTSNENLKQDLFDKHTREIGLREKELRNLNYSIEDLKNENKQLKKENTASLKEIKSLNDNIASLNEVIIRMTKAEEKNSEIIKDKELLISKLNNEVIDLNETIKKKDKYYETIEKECNELGMTPTEIIENYKQLISDKYENEKLIYTLEEDIKEKDILINNQVQEIKSKDIKIEGLNSQIDFYKGFEKTNKKLQEELEEKNTLINNQVHAISDKTTEIKGLNDQIDLYKEQIEHLKESSIKEKENFKEFKLEKDTQIKEYKDIIKNLKNEGK
jgi:predicted  nucleic acid-binding Zn-ribbon protein